MHLEPGLQFANPLLKLSHLTLKLLNLAQQPYHQLGELGTLGTARGRCWHLVVDAIIIGRLLGKPTGVRKKTCGIPLPFFARGGRLPVYQTDGV